jgi:broad specificity phosphatase PhoE
MPEDLIIDLVRHMKARNAGRWTQADGERPLSKLGLRQAALHATAMAEAGPIVGVYSSPALRCRQTIEPLAQRLDLKARIAPLLAETRMFASLPLQAENPLLALLNRAHPEGGRVVACSHGDTIPAILESLNAGEPGRFRGLINGFGGWYRVRVPGSGAPPEISRFDVPPGFPTA